MPENKHPSQFERVTEITRQLEAGIQDLYNSEQYRAWLTTMSKFHDYSLNNTILIAQQKPDATLIAGYTAWQKNFGRHVLKNEKAIRILAPAPYKKIADVPKLDPITGNALFHKDGSMQLETKEITVPAFKVVSVFDVSQTEGRDLPSLGVDELTGNVAQYDLFYKALEKSCPVPIGFEDIVGGAKGYFSPIENRIALNSGMSQVQTVKTLIHEMAHQRLHAVNPTVPEPTDRKLTRNAKEVEAESVAFTVCEHFGIDTSDYSFAYIAGWSQGRDTPELKASMDRIRKTASAMITEISGHFQTLQREYAEAHLTAEDITDIQINNSEYISAGIVTHTGSCTILGEPRVLTYETYREDEGYSFSIHSDGNDIWTTMNSQELRKLEIVLAGAAEAHQIDSEIMSAATLEDLNEVVYSMSENSESAMLQDQREKLWESFEDKRKDILGQTREGQAQLLAEEIVQLNYDLHPFPFDQQHEYSGDLERMTGNLLEGNDSLALTIGAIQDTVILNEVPQVPQCKEVLGKIAEFLGEAHPLTQEFFGCRTTPEHVPALQDNSLYRYYSTQRPVAPGTYPAGENRPVNIENFDSRVGVENDAFRAWGYLEYRQPLTEQQISNYELRAASTNSAERKSVLEALQNKKNASERPKHTQKSKAKETAR